MKINLRVWMFLKIIPYAELFLFYYFSVHQIVSTARIYVLLFLILTVFILLILRRKRDFWDESATMILQKADAICLKVAFIIMIFLLPATLIGGDSSGFIMGEMISGGMFLLATARAIIFRIVDGRGL